MEMSRILVTGGDGMVASSFKSLVSNHEIILAGRKEADLLIREEFEDLLIKTKPEAVIHLAAKVGGVKSNTDYISDFYSENVRINCNVLDACNSLGIKSVISLLSTCVYPDSPVYPLTEDQVHNGSPHPSNFGYAYAKRMLDVQTRAINLQHSRNYMCAIPNNLYGPNDNFDLENGHVIPSIIRKIWEAKLSKKPPVFWGDGTPLREFTYSGDLAKCLIFLLDNKRAENLVNIGSTREVTIKYVVQVVCRLLNYNGEVLWDKSMPMGQLRKPSSNLRFRNMGWKDENYTSLESGLEKTIGWFVENYPNVRGI